MKKEREEGKKEGEKEGWKKEGGEKRKSFYIIIN